MNTEQSFLHAIRNSNDNITILIFADWLEEQGRQKDAEFFRAGAPTIVGFHNWYNNGQYNSYCGFGGDGSHGGYGGYGGHSGYYSKNGFDGDYGGFGCFRNNGGYSSSGSDGRSCSYGDDDNYDGY